MTEIKSRIVTLPLTQGCCAEAILYYERKILTKVADHQPSLDPYCITQVYFFLFYFFLSI